MRFRIDEDDLTNAIFNGSALQAHGAGTKAEAREQAALMLAADKLRDALALVAGIIEETYPHDDEGNRINGDSPVSGADVVDALCAIEQQIAEALSSAKREPGCTCCSRLPSGSAVPNYCRVHDRDYSSWLVANNID